MLVSTRGRGRAGAPCLKTGFMLRGSESHCPCRAVVQPKGPHKGHVRATAQTGSCTAQDILWPHHQESRDPGHLQERSLQARTKDLQKLSPKE